MIRLPRKEVIEEVLKVKTELDLRGVAFFCSVKKIVEAIKHTFYVEEEGLFKAYGEGKTVL